MGGRGQFNPDGGFYRYDFEEDSRVTLPESFKKGKRHVKAVIHKDSKTNKSAERSNTPGAFYIVYDINDPSKIYSITRFKSDRTISYVIDFRDHNGFNPHIHVGARGSQEGRGLRESEERMLRKLGLWNE